MQKYSVCIKSKYIHNSLKAVLSPDVGRNIKNPIFNLADGKVSHKITY